MIGVIVVNAYPCRDFVYRKLRGEIGTTRGVETEGHARDTREQL